MIELYSSATPNGWKAHIVLEELGLAYRAHAIDLSDRDSAAYRHFVAVVNPAGKIPAIVDPDGPDKAPIALGETAAIARYLSEKTGRLGPQTARERAMFDYWAHLITSGLGLNTSGAFTFGVLAPNPDAHARFVEGAYRHLDVFEAALAERPFLAGDRFTYLDCLLFPHLAGSAERLPHKLAAHPSLSAYRDRIAARPSVQRGLSVLAA